ncbi:MAG: hypothetical protein IKP39_02715 [Paludibacteraceae bacterium]|nr:hypothetical protein [Paludibacteraceae bacterium]
MQPITQYYRVGDHVFAIEATQEQFAQLPNYAPFLIDIHADGIAPTHVFIIHVTDEPLPPVEGWEHVYTDRSDEDMPRIEMYQKADEWLFRVSLSRDGDIVSAMRCAADWTEVHLYLLPDYTRFAIDNAAMLVYAFRTTSLNTLLFHSSVTVRGGKGYMFLGHSGTGKSTHSQQWKAAFPDAELLNDDNPVVRILSDETVRVYGSPWSGKTPCYKAADVPVAALVQLAQAPENIIHRLKMTQAYPYILASVSGLKLQPQMMDRLYETIAKLLELSPVYKLECLPNPDAARLCAQTCLS